MTGCVRLRTGCVIERHETCRQFAQSGGAAGFIDRHISSLNGRTKAGPFGGAQGHDRDSKDIGDDLTPCGTAAAAAAQPMAIAAIEVDVVKIDGRYVRELANDGRDAALVIVPRHVERGPSIAELARTRTFDGTVYLIDRKSVV